MSFSTVLHTPSMTKAVSETSKRHHSQPGRPFKPDRRELAPLGTEAGSQSTISESKAKRRDYETVRNWTEISKPTFYTETPSVTREWE